LREKLLEMAELWRELADETAKNKANAAIKRRKSKRSNQPVISDQRVLDRLLAESTDLLSRQVSKWSVVPLEF